MGLDGSSRPLRASFGGYAMSAERIDVLSWFDDLIRNGEEHHEQEARSARAAVAELITDLEVIAGTYAITDEGDWMASIVRTALARVKGATS